MTPATVLDDHRAPWTFLTNHGHVLLALYRNPDLRQREIASLVGITEGAVQRILHELEQSGYVETQRVGRCNHYVIHPDGALRHRLEAGRSVGELFAPLVPDPAPSRPPDRLPAANPR